METFTLVLLIMTCILLVSVIILAVTKWRSWSDSDKSSIAASLFALGKTIYAALKDGKLEEAELRGIFNQVTGILAAIVGVDNETIEARLKAPETTTNVANNSE